jgi:hypothetical protein
VQVLIAANLLQKIDLQALATFESPPILAQSMNKVCKLLAEMAHL